MYLFLRPPWLVICVAERWRALKLRDACLDPSDLLGVGASFVPPTLTTTVQIIDMH